ncbi:RNA polymerase recycling motor ATPase HelR [Nocardioides alcanivorans]|uniref:RNA polymerase recycling motor ATPase HelR n=1 Tax=Nocardioides alcanivorans TaxID=2897352 RepID=UPI001F374730|nr:RNA polymerase recycling motor ATPase HelR [Nocardioides alcanivorans]
MTSTNTSVFNLPDDRSAKQSPALVDRDEQHLALVAAAFDDAVSDLENRLVDVRRQAGGGGQSALDRDQEITRLSTRLRQLRRATLDVCLGRMVGQDGAVTYLGRMGLADREGNRLLVDWRTPAAEPFFAATHARPHGLASRRRYRWTQGLITDYWDEAFTADGGDLPLALDDDSSFLASLGASRSDRMQDVLSTLQHDQDAIIRSGSKDALVVDGGPGTGKTVVALHRAAYLLHADPRLSAGRGGLLFVGPHQPYLNYVADVLPSLGEEGVRTCTLRHLVPGAESFGEEQDARVAALKARIDMIAAVEPAVRLYEEPPTEGQLVETEWSEVWLSADDWAEAFAAVDPETPHNEARGVVWEALLDLLVDKHQLDDGGPTADVIRRALDRHAGLHDAIGGAWPILVAEEVVGDLWSVPAYLRHCAPWLTSDEVRLLQRSEPQAWTVADLPLLDAARLRLGDPEALRRARRRKAAAAAERAHIDDVVQHLLETDIHGDSSLAMLRGEDMREALIDPRIEQSGEPDALGGPFAHIVVDEAQELTDAEWQMLLRRCPTRSFTVVGDRAQARAGFAESWTERLDRIGLSEVRHATLSVNYRTPAEVMDAAAPEIRAVLPDANVPTSVRRSGLPVRHDHVSALEAVLTDWVDADSEGTAVVIGAQLPFAHPRVRSLSPILAKGLEFDLVVLVDPDALGDGVAGAVDRYVAMTRTTRELVVLTSG